MPNEMFWVALLLQISIVFASPCVDDHKFCSTWAEMGECKTTRQYMERHCARSCGCTKAVPNLPDESTTLTTTGSTSSTAAVDSSTATTGETSQATTTSADVTTEVSTPKPSTSSAIEQTSKAPPSTTEPARTTTRTPSPAWAPAPPASSEYIRKANKDLAGDMLAAVPAPKIDACIGMCDATAGCEGFSFYKGVCYMKADLKGTFSKPWCTTMVRKKPDDPKQCSGFASEKDKDLAGILVKPPVYAAEANECCSACTAIPECQGFSYFEDFCYLKGNLHGTYSKPGCTVHMKSSARRLESEFAPGILV
ncbi:unnamed protein product [Durusdinium trenchii]|uniref:Uncharacterized protein n=1 Tax=Durusdinium trenchii TaxID=1381693 RepID=A0ABP0J293_9DINO